jgi:hypothetical protein
MEAVKQELEQIAKLGLINPHTVVERARDPDSALHDQFTWDDTEAGNKWRLEEARRLIRVFVVQPVVEGKEPVRAFVSLSTDRKSGGGYRALADVLSDDELKAQLLQDALDELHGVQVKYSRVNELESVFKAVARVEKKLKPAKPQQIRAAA